MHIVDVWKVWDRKPIERKGAWAWAGPFDGFHHFPSLIYYQEGCLEYAPVGGIDIAIIDGKNCWRRNA